MRRKLFRNERERLEQRRRFFSSGKQPSQPEDDTNKEKEVEKYFSPPNEISQPDDIERNPDRKKEAYDGAIEKLNSLRKENLVKSYIKVSIDIDILYNIKE